MSRTISKNEGARACAGNWHEAYRHMFREWSKGELIQDDKVEWFRSSVPDALLNSVLNVRDTGYALDCALEEVLSWGRFRQVPIWWWTYPWEEQELVGERLVDCGFERERDLPGMVRDLSDWRGFLIRRPGLEVVSVRTLEQLGCFAQIYQYGFGGAAETAQAIREIYGELGLCEEAPWQHYLVLLDGEPVAAASTFLHDEVVGLYNVATLPGARGRGAGKAVITHALGEGKRRGGALAILQATAMGLPIYERLGFRVCAKYGQYRWKPGVE